MAVVVITLKDLPHEIEPSAQCMPQRPFCAGGDNVLQQYLCIGEDNMDALNWKEISNSGFFVSLTLQLYSGSLGISSAYKQFS